MIIKLKMVNLYDNDDEFGIDMFRDDFSVVFKMNSIRVKRYRRIKGNDNSTASDYDYMGLLSSKSKTEYVGDIIINVHSVNIRQKDLKEQGNDFAGVRTLNCYTEYNTEIDSGDIIEFTRTNLRSDIKSGEQFVVKMEDSGLLKEQFCFKSFLAYAVGNNVDIEGR